MKTTREKFLTVAEAEKATGVHYTVNHSGKMEGMQSLSTSCLCNKYCKNRSINSDICKKNKHGHLALWTKNPWIIEEALDASERKPSNLQIIYSSSCINDQADPGYDFIDKIFTVYDKDYISAHDVSINCGAKSCLTCHKCYVKSKIKYINEKLK